MSYLALARKWRPKSFAEVTGQAHIVQALENALTSGRVHHAFLFAGTRGVGKTTIARILAKALNCEKGVVAEPCSKCSNCIAIDEGRFVDLIEVDAASRTKVDDTRDLLDNVQYTPAVGRFKVYLIDEVHMLSRNSFNALLKTLEEPPPHVKFLFATTDPQKLPVTVLSRCLQFNLKRLTTQQIVGRMTHICKAEKLKNEPNALNRLGRAAAGSMRDGLSLLDQALAFGAEKLTDADVAQMLGSMDRHRITELLDLVRGADGAGLIQTIKALDELVPDYELVLDELATALQRVSVIQIAGAEAVDDEDEIEALVQLADELAPEQVQLFYQIAITSRRDLELAPDPRLGFEMAMLRMIAFRQAQPGDASQPAKPQLTQVRVQADKTVSSSARKGKSPGKRKSAPAAGSARAAKDAPEPSLDTSKVSKGKSQEQAEVTDWPGFVAQLELDGAVRELAANTVVGESSPFELRLKIQRRNEYLLTDNLKRRLAEAVQRKLGSGVNLQFALTDDELETEAAQASAQSRQGLEKAKESIDADPDVQQIVDVFGGEIVADSIRPVDPSH